MWTKSEELDFHCADKLLKMAVEILTARLNGSCAVITQGENQHVKGPILLLRLQSRNRGDAS